MQLHRSRAIAALVTLTTLLAGCSGESGSRVSLAAAESCMTCHNGSQHDDYAGPGLEDPHPFGGGQLRCTTCHGGNPAGQNQADSHTPPPPEIGDRAQWQRDAHAYFNRLTLAGMDKFADYSANGRTYTALDYLQFINPGDLRVTSNARGCGQCHAPHAAAVARSPLATEMGILAGSMYAIGVDNKVPASQGQHGDTAADTGFRAVQDPGRALRVGELGAVSELLEQPVYSVFGQRGAKSMFNNPAYSAVALAADLLPDNRVRTDSPLAHVFHEQVAFTCGDCHLGSAGANNRYGDFRSSGCAACHMPYSQDGRSRSRDPNVPKNEPLDPDDIDAPELAHVRSHRIHARAQTLPSGAVVPGIDDHTCAGCHQGSNRTVMQYWGIRLDQNQDVVRGQQYPADPVAFTTTRNDTRLFDPAVNNRTFNGRNHNQYLLFEDYDGDGRDDTPADVHYDAGMGCVDCHGSHDVHGGDVNDPNGVPIHSRMEQTVAIRCENCHGGIEAYAATVAGTAYDGQPALLAVDAKGHPLKHVVKESDGNYYLTSRLNGVKHFIPQTKDTVADSGRLDPFTQQPVYNDKASYAMGRADADPRNGIGPQQTAGVTAGFSHTDNMNCASCHASWTNTCMGCHLKGEYDTGNNFSNITGERIVYRQTNADFVYQSPLFFQLGVAADNKIRPFCANTKVFYQYTDQNNQASRVFSFTDRNSGGNNPGAGYPSLSHNALLAHSIRGRVSASNEGPRYCVTCHLTQDGLARYGAEYAAFRTALANNDFGALDYATLRQHFGQNPGNQLDSPLFVHMVAGLGTGLFLFDRDGCAVNPLDGNQNRIGCNGVAPASAFDPARVVLNLDGVVGANGVPRGSSNHAMLNPGASPNLRDGAPDPDMAGPLGATLIRRLTDPATGIVLDSWLDADGAIRGAAGAWVQHP